MPMYQWASKKLGKTVQVIRAVQDIEVRPDNSECPDAETVDDWKREICATNKGYGAGWSRFGGTPGKGNW